MKSIFNLEKLKKRVILRIMEDLDEPTVVSTSCIYETLEVIHRFGIYKGYSKMDSDDTRAIVKLAYQELLENRAHYLSLQEVKHFDNLFGKLLDQFGNKGLGFTPAFEK